MTKQPHKQRTQTERAPLHKRQKQLHATLSDELREEYDTRRTRVNAGDTVEVMRGDHAGEEGEVVRAILEDGVVHVEDVTVETADGEEVPRPLDPSNVRITDLDLEDERREARLEGENEGDSE
ncbi:50S ribosomal protein L24 [Natronobacterium gregoryi]|uniref:Large ribosomal subunit protein uL24 n=2 Tax=Natronobacterium gregoryi TaxID=44930 RepID=L0AEK0_NATGS|nr:50S ribosomal protein L24 [Natronobacterium gregoryi]AFZ71562.1 ribosomal protein L24p/L26e, archaeal/eukaryotic [Natronobacterium gregoryi SP2]ELY66619.1 50S ribosomal protein L24P [Natronobacterium gregoryi SP2]PLK21331.1 50S ribosomal protein L24 [Natronobacterium gregoryi SP2]SFI81717.1 LSU ribosomal protein L24P [Natronobacterium gregoryi]